MKYVGYHGTDLESANAIENYGFSDSEIDAWLGAGVYFFEDLPPFFKGEKEALWWVEEVKKFKYWVLFKAEIASENVLDLVENKNDKLRYKKLWDVLLKKHLEAGHNPEDFSCHDVILQLSRKVEVVRCMVDAAKPTAELNSYIVGHPQIQLCVCKNSGRVIRNYSKCKEN